MNRVCAKLFFLLKRRTAKQVDSMKENVEEEFRIVAKQSKRRSTHSIFS